MKRASLSKRTRFKIFERDKFTCQYCGNRPPEIVLQLDHIHPVSEGGSDSEDNLTTSCVPCNQGKTNRIMGTFIPRPDSDLQFLETQQEIAEARRFLSAQSELTDLRLDMVAAIQGHWFETLEMQDVPAKKVILEWLVRYTPEQVIESIDHFLPAIRKQPWRFRSEHGFTQCVRYVSGILRNRAEV